MVASLVEITATMMDGTFHRLTHNVTQPGRELVVSGLTPNTEYTVKVSSGNKNGEHDAPWAFTTTRTPLAITWNGPTSGGSWWSPGNWTDDRLPCADEHVIIPETSGNVTLDGDVYIQGVTFFANGIILSAVGRVAFLWILLFYRTCLPDT